MTIQPLPPASSPPARRTYGPPDVGDRIEADVGELFRNGENNFVVPSPGQMQAFGNLVAGARSALRDGHANAMQTCDRQATALGYHFK